MEELHCVTVAFLMGFTAEHPALSEVPSDRTHGTLGTYSDRKPCYVCSLDRHGVHAAGGSQLLGHRIL